MRVTQTFIKDLVLNQIYPAVNFSVRQREPYRLRRTLTDSVAHTIEFLDINNVVTKTTTYLVTNNRAVYVITPST